MKKVLILVAVIMFGVCACAQKEENLGDTYILGEDNQYYFDSELAFAESEESYYLFGGEYLFSKNKETEELSVLCDKPDCLHDYETDLTRKADCNAYYGNGAYVYYYKNKLYIWVEGSDRLGNTQSTIYEMDLNGSTRKKILELEEYVMCVMIHRGYLYLSFSDFLEDPEVYENDEEKRKNSSYRVERYRLDKISKKPEVIFEKTGEFGQINEMSAYGNKIYMKVSGVGNRPVRLIYDLQLKTTEEFSKRIDGDLTLFCGKTIYYEGGESTEVSDVVKSHEGETATIGDAEGNPAGTMKLPFCYRRFSNDELIANDNNHEVLFDYYEREDREVSFYDKDGNLLRKIKLENGTIPSIGMNKDYFFYLKPVQDNASGYEIWAIDLHRLDDENLKGECFFSYESPVDAPLGIVY